jgi:hypothetical protein
MLVLIAFLTSLVIFPAVCESDYSNRTLSPTIQVGATITYNATSNSQAYGIQYYVYNVANSTDCTWNESNAWGSASIWKAEQNVASNMSACFIQATNLNINDEICYDINAPTGSVAGRATITSVSTYTFLNLTKDVCSAYDSRYNVTMKFDRETGIPVLIDTSLSELAITSSTVFPVSVEEYTLNYYFYIGVVAAMIAVIPVAVCLRKRKLALTSLSLEQKDAS